MNHHDFRVFIQKMPVAVLKQNNINPAHFKAVCFTISMYGTYESGNKIFPSWLTVAKEAGVDRKTAMKVRDFLLEHNVLITIKKRPKNVSEYEFGVPSEQLSNLINQLSNSEDQLSNSQSQLSNNSGHNTITDTITQTINNSTIENHQDDFMNEKLIENQEVSISMTENDNDFWITASDLKTNKPQLSNFDPWAENQGSQDFEEVLNSYLHFGKI